MNQENIKKHKANNKTHFLVRAIIVGIIFSITFFLILMDASKEYKASVLILLTAKNENASSQIESITENVSDFPKMLSFYDRILKYNPQIEDKFSGKNKDKRKDLWNKMIEVSIGESKKGSIIELAVFSKNYSESQDLIKIASKNLFEVSSIYYDANDEIGMSILDGPLVSVVTRKIYLVVALAFIFGMLVSLLLNWFLSILEKFIKSSVVNKRTFPKVDFKKSMREKVLEKKEDEFRFVDKEEYPQDIPYDFNNFIKDNEFNNDVNFMLEKESKEIFLRDNKYPNYPEMPLDSVKDSAPDNLPIADNIDMFRENTDKNNTSQQEQEPIEIKKGEPTTEELKKRLNDLLQGKM